MIEMTLAQAINILNTPTSPLFPDKKFTGLSIDTRTLQPSNLFIALKGSHADGHNYVESAYQKGASAALVTHLIASPLPQILVNDTVMALGLLGKAWRKLFHIPMIAVTGSNGKTTLKNMIAAILTAACQNNSTHVLATQGTLNNHLGLPLTLARLHPKHRYAVLEMGMNHFGEIKYLTQLAHPTIAVITNAAACHLEGVGDIAGVARAKAEIFIDLPTNGVAILNRDDAFFTYWQKEINDHSLLTFGYHQDADIRALIHENTPSSAITFLTPKGKIDIQLPLLGKHNILNALAATAATLAMDIDLTAIKQGLESLESVPGRLQLHALANGVNIIDDTYNANPFSLQAAVETLATFHGKKILVLGDMKELGTEAKPLHFAAGEKIRAAGINYLFTYGELSAHCSNAFGEGAYHFSEQDKLIDALKPFLYNQTTILIKGSRSMRMEKIVAELIL
ncbi:MAG: hypothetical protein A3F42_00425 [Gammaproteobacteria bacterium RIFCSPHIGHO2_12_FULL_37_34]|nr:MAG: hypothetical protein A3F42_00425 [Gammaproteobacteria bacterium RIFCSPHIGHO2_12_FULL_37_34]